MREFAIFLASCAVHGDHAADADHDHPGGRRLLPLAAIHRDQYGGLCRGRTSADEPRYDALVSVNQQLSISAGVAVGAFSVESTMLMRGITELAGRRFCTGLPRGRHHLGASAWFFWQMPDDAGHEISGRKVIEDRQPARARQSRSQSGQRRQPAADARDQKLGEL